MGLQTSLFTMKDKTIRSELFKNFLQNIGYRVVFKGGTLMISCFWRGNTTEELFGALSNIYCRNYCENSSWLLAVDYFDKKAPS